MPILPRAPWVSILALSAAAATTECYFSLDITAGCVTEPASGSVWDLYQLKFVNRLPKACPIPIIDGDRVAASGVFTDYGVPDFVQGDVRVSNSPSYGFVKDAPIFFRPKDGAYVGEGYIYWNAGTGFDKCTDFVVYSMTQYADFTPTGLYPQVKVTATYQHNDGTPDCSGAGGDNMVVPASAPSG